jgi:pyruvate dehydrogenase E2 component (dihydrolipoamide acetyltransferase)
MAHILVLEALYPEMEEATIGRWLVAEGETVAADMPLAELITDKVAYEVQSPWAGVVLAQLPAEKSVVPVGTALAVIGAAGERVDNREALETENRRLAAEREAQLSALHAATGQVEVKPAATGGAVRATPAARRLARERGVDLATLRGSGPDGMITVDDIPQTEA